MVNLFICLTLFVFDYLMFIDVDEKRVLLLNDTLED